MSTYERAEAFRSAQLGELRSLLQSRPGPKAWAQVCKLAQAWRGEAFEQVERYIEDHIQGWPDAARTLPKTWRAWIARGEDVPQARLVRHLSFGDSQHPQVTRHMARRRRMLECPHLSQITHLSIDGLSLDAFDESVALVQAFIARQPQPLEHVKLLIFAGRMPDEVHKARSATWNDLLNNLPTRALSTNLTYDNLDTCIELGTPLSDHLEALTASLWSNPPELLAQLTTARLPHLKQLKLGNIQT